MGNETVASISEKLPNKCIQNFTEWVIVNLLGWFIAFQLIGFERSEAYAYLGALTKIRYIPDGILVLFCQIGVALSIVLGISQALKMRSYKIPSVLWIIVTACGLSFSTIIIPQLRQILLFNESANYIHYTENLWIIVPFTFFCIGLINGLLQSVFLGVDLNIQFKWILANAFGFLLAEVFISNILIIPIKIQEMSLEKDLMGLSPYPIPGNLILPLIWILFPIIGALSLSMMTGFVVYKRQ